MHTRSSSWTEGRTSKVPLSLDDPDPKASFTSADGCHRSSRSEPHSVRSGCASRLFRSAGTDTVSNAPNEVTFGPRTQRPPSNSCVVMAVPATRLLLRSGVLFHQP